MNLFVEKVRRFQVSLELPYYLNTTDIKKSSNHAKITSDFVDNPFILYQSISSKL